MSAVEETEIIASQAPAQSRSRWCALVMTAAGFGLTLLVFYPAYSTADARYVYADATAWRFGDWQSPAMAVLWRLIDPIAPGSASMFLLTASLYWIAFGTLAFLAGRRSVWLALATPFVALAPPAFFFVGMVWRDVLFGVIWFVAAVLAFFAAEHAPHWRCCWSHSGYCCGRMPSLLHRFLPPMSFGQCASIQGGWRSPSCPRSLRSMRWSLSSTTTFSVQSDRIRSTPSSFSISEASAISPERTSFRSRGMPSRQRS